MSFTGCQSLFHCHVRFPKDRQGQVIHWLSSIVVVALCLLTQRANAEVFRVYIGTYTGDGSSSQGIYLCEFDTATGKLTEPRLVAEEANPSFLAIHPSQKFVFCVNELVEGEGRANARVTALSVQADGTLKRINSQPTLGGAPCHCNVDATGKSLLVANYIGGNVIVLPIEADGTLRPASSNMVHGLENSGDGKKIVSRAHSVNLSSDNRFAYVADLGLDQILVYELDADKSELRPADPPFTSVHPGGGPRHFAIHPSGKFAYTNNETTLVATAFRRDPVDGSLTVIQDISTLPEAPKPGMSTAECLVHPNGEFLYVSNRGHESIAVFSIESQTGLLTHVQNSPTGGKEPRNFVIDPSGRWILAENQNSDSIHVLAIDQQTGRLSLTGNSITVGRPVCIRMVSVQ